MPPEAESEALRLGPIAEIDAGAWNALLTGGYPFLDHAFLALLEAHGCTTPETGWQPLHLSLGNGTGLAAAAPLYLKGHGHGEFIYDWQWAGAAERAGRRYYPKLFLGPPFTPARGPRLLGPRRQELPALLQEIARRHGLSSVHVGAAAADDQTLLEGAGFLSRSLWQFHWHNRGYRDFDDFLDALRRRKRKNIRQERRKARETGWSFELITGEEADAGHWRHMHRCYQLTFARKGNWPTLTEGFFLGLGRELGARTLLSLARDPEGRLAAGALLLRSDDTLYGRYWGAVEEVPFVHFEACYYRPMEFAIATGLKRFEPGAQGTHKIARGFDPAPVTSCHWFADAALAAAVDEHLRWEHRQHLAEGEALREQSAYP